MPELPEVETMVRGLRPAVEGRRLRAAALLDPAMVGGCDPDELRGRLSGATVERVGRRGKWVVWALGDRAGIIVIQPRMTGGFWLVPPDRPQHVRIRWDLDGSPGSVWYCDARRLGRLIWLADAAALEGFCSRSQGPDALEITPGELAAHLEATSRAIKPALMDQKVVAGIGNIYADEILHHAGIHPSHPSDRLRPAQIDRLHAAIRHVLDVAIAAEGSSFDAGYRTVLGLEGGFLAQNAVHRRRGEACGRCGGTIVRERIAGLIGRSTYYCPGCQRLGRGRR